MVEDNKEKDMSSPQLEICEKCGLRFYSVLGETICPECEKKESTNDKWWRCGVITKFIIVLWCLFGEVQEYHSLYTDYKCLHRNYKLFGKVVYSQTIKLWIK